MSSHAAPDEMAMAEEDLPAEALINPGVYNPNITYPDEPVTMGISQFDVSQNNLNGTIPTTIGELIHLQAVDVSNNPELGADGCCDRSGRPRPGRARRRRGGWTPRPSRGRRRSEGRSAR